MTTLGMYRMRWAWATVVAILALAGVLLGGCGENAKARFYYDEAFGDARRIESDPAKKVRYLRGAARLFESPEHVAAARRNLGVSPAEEGVDAALAAEYRARADAVEANPRLYAQTERCAADIVAERFRLEARSRGGPQPECGHCVGAPVCPPWPPSAGAERS